jgi:hypothetical protein
MKKFFYDAIANLESMQRDTTRGGRNR